MKCALDKTDADNWREVIPNRDDVLLSGIDEFKDFIVFSERKDGLVQIRI